MAASCIWCGGFNHLGIQCHMRNGPEGAQYILGEKSPVLTNDGACEHNQGCPHREDPIFDQGDLSTEEVKAPKECKGKSAARTLLMMVLDPKINAFLRENDPKALEQAEEALKPFGYPDAKALMEKFKV